MAKCAGAPWHLGITSLIIFSFKFSGFYVAPTQKESTLNSSVEKLTEHIVSELNNGAFDCPEVKCGFIGEIGCCDPLDGKDIKLK